MMMTKTQIQGAILNFQRMLFWPH